ncbi:MAG TPA: efflux RND transporter periplasmic adaptor subunit [Clostridia bacterium]|nr:efflux RND transporter periplasmic adaptor subunit [Clostridia bacterium]
MKIITTALIAILFLTGCSKPEKKQAEQDSATPVAKEAKREDTSILHIEQSMLRDLRITTTAVEFRTGGESMAILGELHPNENAYAEIGAPIPSRIVSINVAPGQAVSAGKILAVLQSSEVGKARSDAITAQARLELAKRTLERKQRLGAEKIVAQREIQEADANMEAAAAELRAAKATLRSLGLSAADAENLTDNPNFSLRSPVSGTVIDRNAVQGQLAEPSKPLFRVGNLGRLWLTVHAFERDAVRVMTGSTARIAFPALPGRSFSGKVTLVGKQVEADSRTVPIRIEVENRDGVLRPGMSATAWLKVCADNGKVLAVPAASLQRLQEKWIIFIPKAEREFEMRTVGRGRDLGGEVEILSGLKAGETVVVDGAFLLKAQSERSLGEGEEHNH